MCVSVLDLPVRKLHIARKYMFYLLYYTEFKDLFCFNTSTIYFIAKMLNIKGHNHLKKYLKENNTFLQIKGIFLFL